MRRPLREVATTTNGDSQSSDLPLYAGDDEKSNSNNGSNGHSGVCLCEHNKCWRTIFFNLVAGAVITTVLGLLSGTLTFDMLTRTPQKFAVLDERCEQAARHLKRQNIKLLALDFDLTVIDQHTGGRWKGTAEELSDHVRPEIQCFLNSAFNRRIDAAIVTFSTQIDLIGNVTGQTFPGQYIPVHGWYTAKDGKQLHLVRAINDINAANGNRKISNATTILIDDDKRNIKKARKEGYRTIWYDPDADNPMFLVESIINNYVK
mmetsp:Transcript_4762/g.8107  ORF Transcript_4762/g.8107 Transcript_4762/m.8107 type:complete len:262 (-) Transcript_4762:20-805(-)